MSQKLQKNNNVKYFMIFVCMLIQAIPFGVAQNIQPLFIPYVLEHFHFTLASFSLIFTFGALAASVFSPFLGKLFGKINIKTIFLIGTVISSLSFIGFGYATNLATFYLLSAISQIGCVFFSGLGIAYLIGCWFPNKGRGKALGLAFSGGSIGNVFLQPWVSSMLGSKGDSKTYIFFGILSLIVSIVVVLLFVRSPKQGEIDTSENVESSNNVDTTKTYEGLGAKETRKNKYFWIFSLGYALIGMAISACSTQYASYFKINLQLSPALIGTLGSVFAVFCLLGNVGGGALFDRIGSFKSMALAFIFQAVAIIAMLLGNVHHAFTFGFSIFYGLCVYSYMSGPAFLATDLFGRKESSVNLGVISLLFAIGFAIGSSIFGVFTDSFSYEVAWIAMLAFLVIGYVLLLLSIHKVKEQQK